jgi:ADP-heptose:LPS heptosyltransferase
MHIELMRVIDYWLGVPLCFLLSAAAAAGRAMRLGGRPAENAPRKVMFIKLSEMGAIILAYPLLTRVKKDRPEAEIFFVTFQRNKDSFLLFPGLIKEKNILTIRDCGPAAFISDTFRVIRRMRREKIDIIFDLEFFSRFTAILAYLSAAAKRIGFHPYNYEGLYRGNLFTHKVQYNPQIHIANSYLSLWQAAREREKTSPELGEKIEDEDISLPEIIPAQNELEKAKNSLRESGVGRDSRVFLLNPGEGMLPLREWPLDNFIRLAKKILADKKNYVVLIGTKEAAKKAGQLLKEVDNQQCINLVGKTGIADLPALFSVSAGLIANDCGLGHIAALSKIKKIIIFGPESPRIFGPLGVNNFIFYSGLACSPCLSALNHRKSSCRDNKCLKAIGWEAVYSLINQHLL